MRACLMLLIALFQFALASDGHDSDHGHDSNGTHCEPHHPGSIFQLGKELDENPVSLSVLFLFVTLLSIMFDHFTAWLEKRTSKHHHLYELLLVVYRELMVVGFINLLLFVIQQIGHVDKVTVGGNTFDEELFEFVHMFLFFHTIFYVVTVLVLLLLIRVEWGRWKKLSRENPEEIVESFLSLEQQRRAKGWFWLLNPLFVYRWYSARRKQQFSLVKLRFLTSQIQVSDAISDPMIRAARHKPSVSSHGHGAHNKVKSNKPKVVSGEELKLFDFGKYLRRCVRHDVLEILEIDYKVWLLVMLIAVVNIIRVRGGGEFHSSNHGVVVFISVGYGFLALFLFILARVSMQLSKYYRRLEQNTASGEMTRRIQQSASRADFSGSHDPSIMLVNDEDQFEQRGYFWFRRPHLTLHCIQAIVLLQSFYLSLYCLVFAHRINTYVDRAVPLVHIMALLPALLVIFVFLPMILPLYTLLSHVENLTHRKHLSYVMLHPFVRRLQQSKQDEHSDDEDEDEESHHNDDDEDDQSHGRNVILFDESKTHGNYVALIPSHSQAGLIQ